jgi:ABC-2 type transport system ATP-binding protein
MDEAERCHRLAYLAEGRLLISGTAQEVIAHARLATWSVSGTDLFALAQELRREPAIAMVVPFGNTLHVSGSDGAALEAALAAYRGRPELTWTQAQPGLEDVFIRLMDDVAERASS